MTTEKQHALLQFKSQCNPVNVTAAVKVVKCRFCRSHGSPAVTFLAHRPVWQTTPLETSTHSAKGIVGLCSFTVTLFASFLSLKTTIPSSFRKSAVTEFTRGATLTEGTSLSICNAMKLKMLQHLKHVTVFLSYSILNLIFSKDNHTSIVLS